MKPRHVAQIRLGRSTVGQSVVDERPLPKRLHGRGEISATGEGFRPDGDDLVWDHRPVPIGRRHMVEPEPNAPLLKRIIRYPMEMEPHLPVRVRIFDSSRPDPVSTDRDAVSMVFKLPREARDVRNPMLTIEHEPEWRPHPFKKRRLSGEAE